jgi:hypothetical protein
MRILFLALVVALLAPLAEAADLYRIMMVRAAPGELIQLIDLFKETMPAIPSDERPFWMRHSQGDQWDLLLVYPVESFTEFYSAERVARRAEAVEDAGMSQDDIDRRFHALFAWHEDIFVEGPPLNVVKEAFDGAGYFHVEIFRALPGKLKELLREREMENVYLEKLGRPQNLTLLHREGAAWDVFSLGFYRDLKHYAESADLSAADQEAAAKTAGFDGADRIGTYLRSLMAEHHDTLAVPIK